MAEGQHYLLILAEYETRQQALTKRAEAAEQRLIQMEARARKAEERLIHAFQDSERLKQQAKRTREQSDGNYVVASKMARNLFADCNPLHKRAQLEIVGQVLDMLEQQRLIVAGLDVTL